MANRSSGYVLVKGELKNQNWVSPTLNTTADGALYLTVYDMAKWDAALYGEKLLKKASLDQMWTRVKLNDGKTTAYGFGWGVVEVNKHRLIEHGGSWQGFKSHIARYADDKFTVVVFANLTQSNPTRMAHNIAAIYNHELASESQAAIEDKDPNTTALAKKVWQQLVEGNLDSSLFTADAWPEISRNASETRATIKALGSPASFELLERNEQNGRRASRYRITLGNTALSYGVILTTEGKITLLRILPQ